MKAIILAAGKGTRLLPMTLVKPKPLLEIHGKTILENAIDILKDGGVDDITVVTGYKHELFDPLQKKLGFKKVVATDFNTKNSSDSIRLVKNEITNGTIIMNGDLYIKKSFFEYIMPNECQFLAQEIKNAVLWEYIIDEDNKLLRVIDESTNGLGETGIAYLAGKYVDTIVNEIDNCTDSEYWEHAIFRALGKIDFYISKADDIVTEVDSFKDAIINDVLTFDDIAKQCSDTGEALRLKSLTNYSYKIKFNKEDKVIRIPGIGTEKFIDRASEKHIMSLIPEYIAPRSMFFDYDIKITDYLDGYVDIDESKIDDNFISLFTKRLQELHSIKLKDNPGFVQFIILKKIKTYEKLAGIDIVTEKEKEFIYNITKEIDKDEKVLCHFDLIFGNVLYNGKDVKLIDFEYAGFTSKYLDIADFICEGDFNDDIRNKIIEAYGDLDDLKVRKAQIIFNYIWSLWGIFNKSYEYMRFHISGLHKNLSYFNLN
ncbi:sugar phosphate nucleotidyltransferase [Brachyspira hyodysenteriae]|uniref:sugar phosphate nucleotidyltransferase n=1 Tax=Brachyspira hyodysenteriae TaxID=159 RepID=UPI000A161EAE|nr:sugar phosphate nucleotidyltransferase [Brachyspira hyodysenteriae]